MPDLLVDLDQLRRLEPTESWQSALVAHGMEIVPAGPFLALLYRSDGKLELDCAAPTEPVGTDDEVIRALHDLRETYGVSGAAVRIELNEPLFPTLAPLLERCGFALTRREPLLICTPLDFRAFPNPAVGVRFLKATDPEPDLVAYQSIFSEVLLERAWEPTPKRIARFRAGVERGGNRSHALASLEGSPVGTGFISSVDQVCEITRVATLPAYRRRGVAATLTSFMVHDRFEAGDTLAWLTATDAAAQALYEKLGFCLVGARLYYEASGVQS